VGRVVCVNNEHSSHEPVRRIAESAFYGAPRVPLDGGAARGTGGYAKDQR